METDKIPAAAARVRALLSERMGRRATLSSRLLPRRLRAAAQTLAAAETMALHPKLRARIDLPAVARAEAALTRYLAAIDPAARRRARLLDVAALVALIVLLVAAAVVAGLRWRGMV